MKRKELFYISTYNLIANKFNGVKCLYRYDPIPSTGVQRSWHGDYMKKPKTTQERRMSLACDRKYVRGKRSFCNLPESWDDYVISAIYNKRDWKKKKIKRQWMKI